ncbi:hypothetical protein ACFL59_15595 [Planctomycetota bacterium]
MSALITPAVPPVKVNPTLMELPQYRRDLLQQQGLENPVEELTASLRSRPDLIPHEAVLGGRMGFRGDIHVLNERWVYADFEDGHIGGHALLSYAVRGDGRIVWTLIDSFLEE